MFIRQNILDHFDFVAQPNHHTTLTWHSDSIKATNHALNLKIFISPSSISYGGAPHRPGNRSSGRQLPSPFTTPAHFSIHGVSLIRFPTAWTITIRSAPPFFLLGDRRSKLHGYSYVQYDYLNFALMYGSLYMQSDNLSPLGFCLFWMSKCFLILYFYFMHSTDFSEIYSTDSWFAKHVQILFIF
jgi:hypothetical protein